VVKIYVVQFWVATTCSRVGHYQRFGNLLYFQYKDPEIDTRRSSETLVTAGENMTHTHTHTHVGQLLSRLRESHITSRDRNNRGRFPSV
jgi:hypothetical protein